MAFDPVQRLQEPVSQILGLVDQEASIKNQLDFTVVETSLKKALSPKFEVVFAGAFSAGKSMLINALLGRELLYSAEGHATGTECHIEYADPDRERVVLTFLSGQEIQKQIRYLASFLSLGTQDELTPEVLELLQQGCLLLLQREGGESKSEIAKQSKALSLLINGYRDNQDRIHLSSNAVYSMEQFNFHNLSEAASYARRGSNGSVLKRIDYYCHHPLLKDGNVLVDMPGIDAPVKQDALLTYEKIEHPDTSAVVCILKPAAAGDMTTEETELLEKIRLNPGIRDRVFFVFNRIDQTWYNSQLRQRLDGLIAREFSDGSRVYKTSGLLGFYGSQLKGTGAGDRFGLDSIFRDSVKSLGGEEETPQFVSEFNNYCANSGKLTRTPFKVSVNGYETPNENYVRILQAWGMPLIDQLITDSGIDDFRQAITRYLLEEKRPQLYAALADDLQPLCITLRNHYLQQWRDLDSQPREVELMKSHELSRLNQELQEIALSFREHITTEVNQMITNADRDFEEDFGRLKVRMVSRLDELLQTFSVEAAYRQATVTHPRNATAPLLAVLVEALYYLANALDDVLVEMSAMVARNVFKRLRERVQKADYYRKLYRLLGEDSGIENVLHLLETKVIAALENQSHTECDRYVRESPRFYDENTFSIYQFRQVLLQTSQGFDCESMVKAEPAIRQLLRLDFEPKVDLTIRSTFRQVVNQTLKNHLLEMVQNQEEIILQRYDQARAHLEQALELEAAEKIKQNLQNLEQLKEKIHIYNQAVNTINHSLDEMQVYERNLPSLMMTESPAIADT